MPNVWAHKIGNNANFMCPYVWHFFCIGTPMMLVYVKLDVSGYERIIFKGCRLHWSSSFLMAQLKQSWQHWHSCIAESLCKSLLESILGSGQT